MYITPKLATAVAASALSLSLLSSPASAASCTTGSVADYVALGSGGCSVGPLTFSNITVTPQTLGNAGVQLTGFNVFNNGTEFGLILSYLALAGSPLSSADVLWSYNVTADAGTSITDAYVDLAPLITGSGQAGVSDVLDNLSQPITIVCTLAGCDPSNPLVVSFAPVSTIHVSKDQSNAVFGEAGTVITSEVTNAFSVSPVPLPASLPLFTGGLGLLAYLGRRRRKPMTEALA